MSADIEDAIYVAMKHGATHISSGRISAIGSAPPRANPSIFPIEADEPADARRVPAEHHVLLVFDKAVYVARVDDGYLVSWPVDGAEASETFRDPLAAVERAIALQGELA